jgi:hypothetical protein
MQSSSPPTNTTSAPTTEAENSPPATGDAVRVARWAKNPNGGGMTALVVGSLAVVNNCLVISSKDAPPILPIFPYGTGVWDDAKQTFTYRGKVIRIGETIETGGGGIQLDTLKEMRIKYDVPDCGVTNFLLAN